MNLPEITEPFFSVIVPVYNVERYLPECLDQLLAQTYSNFEAILVNDGSTDSSPEICRRYAAGDDRFQVIDKENAGLFMARCTGLEEAKGKYVVHVDSDDSIVPDALQSLYDEIEATGADVVIYKYELVDDNGTSLEKKPGLFESHRAFEGPEKRILFEWIINSHELNNLWLKCCRRELTHPFTDLTPYSGISMGEDVVHSLPLFTNANKIVYLDQWLYRYRVNLNSISNKIKPQHLYDFIRVRKAVVDALRVNGYEELIPRTKQNAFHGICNYLLKFHLSINSETYKEVYNKVCSDPFASEVLKTKGVSAKDKAAWVFCNPRLFSLGKAFSTMYYKK